MTTGVDHLIDFDTALLARNEGFDLWCQNAFLLKMIPPYTKETWNVLDKELNSGEAEPMPQYNYMQSYQEAMVKTHRLWRNNPSHPQTLARPTQTTLSKWLREKHGIYIELIIDGWDNNDKITDEYIGYRAFVWKIGKPKPHHNDDLGMSTYEKIMEVALKYALCIVKID